MVTKYESVGSLVAPSTSSASLRSMGKVHSRPAPRPSYRHIFIITGPAGCGKSSVAIHLAKQLDLPYIEGDDVCPPAFATSSLLLFVLPPR